MSHNIDNRLAIVFATALANGSKPEDQLNMERISRGREAARTFREDRARGAIYSGKPMDERFLNAIEAAFLCGYLVSIMKEPQECT